MVADHMINYEQTMKSPANNANAKFVVNKISTVYCTKMCMVGFD